MEEPWKTIVEIIIFIIATVVIIPYIPSLFETDESPILLEDGAEEREYRIFKYTIKVRKEEDL